MQTIFKDCMQDNRFKGFNQEVQELVLRFEKMLNDNKAHYFDVEEFEFIIDYYMEFENIEGMRKALRYASQIFPQATPVKLRKAQYYAIENESEKALRLLVEIEALEPENSDLHYIRGTIYSQLQSSEMAIEEYNKAIKIGDEGLEDIYSNIAYEYENLGRNDKAIEYFKKALEINPSNDTFLFDLASNMDVEQKYAECVDFLEAFIRNHPYSANAWFNLGMTYMRFELFEKAIDAFDYALCINEELSMAYSCKAICYSSLKQSGKAIETLKEGLRKTTDKTQFLFLIAQEYELLENYETAVIYYKDAIKSEPYFAKAHLSIGVCYDKLEDFNSGHPYLVKSIELEPQNPDFLLTAANILSYRERYEEATLLFEQCVALDMENGNVWTAFADMYADMDMYEVAVETLERGRLHVEDDLEIVCRIAAYNFLLGKMNNTYLAIHELLEQVPLYSSTLLEFCPEMGDDENILNIIKTYTD